MKNIMWKYFTAKHTQKHIDVLPRIVEKYNNTYHRSIKLTLQMHVTQQSINMYTMHSMQELQLSVHEIFSIERVLKKKKNQVLVKWKGCRNAFNSWIPLADLEA